MSFITDKTVSDLEDSICSKEHALLCQNFLRKPWKILLFCVIFHHVVWNIFNWKTNFHDILITNKRPPYWLFLRDFAPKRIFIVRFSWSWRKRFLSTFCNWNLQISTSVFQKIEFQMSPDSRNLLDSNDKIHLSNWVLSLTYTQKAIHIDRE